MLEKVIEIYNKNKDIKYGWKDKNGKFFSHISEGLAKKFSFQSCEEIEKSRVAICWETVELNRKYLIQENIPCKAYFFVIPKLNFYCHSVLVFEDKNKFYWLENSFKDLLGIREYNDLQELFIDVLLNFKQIVKNKDINLKNIKIYEYEAPTPGINCVQYYFHCFKSKNITKKYLNNCLNSIEEKNK